MSEIEALRRERPDMWAVTAQVLPLALVLTISPIPIIAQIAVLFTEQPRRNAACYLAGFVLGVGGLLAVLLALAMAWDVTDPGSGRSAVVSWALLGLGAALVMLAVRKYTSRPRAGEEPPAPAWMARLDSLSAPRFLGLGCVVGALNPKNLVAVVPAAAAIAGASPTPGAAIGAAAAFTALASAGVLAPLALAVVMGARATPVLESSKAWLSRNNAVVMAVLYLVIGLVLIAQSVSDIVS